MEHRRSGRRGSIALLTALSLPLLVFIIGLGDTEYVGGLISFNTILPANGSGASAASPLNYVFVITETVQDTTGPRNLPWFRCNGPIDSTQCTPLKSKAPVVIYQDYRPIMAYFSPTQFENSYAALVKPFADQIAPQ